MVAIHIARRQPGGVPQKYERNNTGHGTASSQFNEAMILTVTAMAWSILAFTGDNSQTSRQFISLVVRY